MKMHPSVQSVVVSALVLAFEGGALAATAFPTEVRDDRLCLREWIRVADESGFSSDLVQSIDPARITQRTVRFADPVHELEIPGALVGWLDEYPSLTAVAGWSVIVPRVSDSRADVLSRGDLGRDQTVPFALLKSYNPGRFAPTATDAERAFALQRFNAAEAIFNALTGVGAVEVRKDGVWRSDSFLAFTRVRRSSANGRLVCDKWVQNFRNDSDISGAIATEFVCMITNIAKTELFIAPSSECVGTKEGAL